MKELVIDLSYYNKTVDFQKLKKAGVYGVIIRAGYGKLASQKDTRFEEYYAGAKAAGLHIGTYWYSYAKSANEVKTEMKVFMNVIKNKSIDMFAAFDLEDRTQSPLGKTVLTEMASTALEYIHSSGYQAVLYTSASWLMDLISISKLPSYVKYWVACYTTKAIYNQYTSSSFCAMHQYTDTGKVDGVFTNVDMNYCYFDFISSNKNNNNNSSERKVEMYTKDNLNIRLAPSTAATIVTTLTKGSTLTVVLGTEKIVGNYEWVKCIINNEELWCAKTYLSASVVANKKANMIEIKSGNWNIRKEPRISSRVVKIVKGGTSYEYTNIRTISGIKWYYVNNYAGWICSTGVKRTYVL